MHGALQLALTALSATVAVAAPASKGLAKRSFQAQTNGRGVAPNPLDEINLTHRKYGWEIIIINPEGEMSTTTTLEPPAPFSTASSASIGTSVFVTYATTSSPTYAPSSAVPYGYDNSTTTSGSASPTGSSAPGSEDGSVAANPEANEKEYLSPVTIGGQKFNLDFDTGSADL